MWRRWRWKGGGTIGGIVWPSLTKTTAAEEIFQKFEILGHGPGLAPEIYNSCQFSYVAVRIIDIMIMGKVTLGKKM